ncbi:hypothetical protein A5893_15850 [Pedobacter psychrophilus]|uniref:Uncharacterized protein n=2 Tax=Pedobacter psychrophilus TaxID=1826909 RepID=A0A179DCR9_9SPHI|nr:hypothetical protein A5893_15850 [Pedobacter psychrophilus]
MIAAVIILTACNNDSKDDSTSNDSTSVSMDEDNAMTDMDKPVVKPGKYKNLSTGEDIEITRDETTGIAVDSKTQLPVEFYYDPITMDTLYQNGMKVNNMLVSLGDGKYKLDDMKIKIDGDEIKIKTDTSKIKIDNDTYKSKSGDEKTKVTDDKMKIKDETGKVKITEDGTKIKPKS